VCKEGARLVEAAAKAQAACKRATGALEALLLLPEMELGLAEAAAALADAKVYLSISIYIYIDRSIDR